MNISREAQDEYAINSYMKSQAAAKAGVFKAEITPVTVKSKKGGCLSGRAAGKAGLKISNSGVNVQKFPTIF